MQTILQGIFKLRWAEAVAISRTRFGHAETDAALVYYDTP
jgi:hypothetical protein